MVPLVAAKLGARLSFLNFRSDTRQTFRRKLHRFIITGHYSERVRIRFPLRVSSFNTPADKRKGTKVSE